MSQQQLNAGLLQGDVGHIGLIPVAAIGTIPASSDITATAANERAPSERIRIKAYLSTSGRYSRPVPAARGVTAGPAEPLSLCWRDIPHVGRERFPTASPLAAAERCQ